MSVMLNSIRSLARLWKAEAGKLSVLSSVTVSPSFEVVKSSYHHHHQQTSWVKMPTSSSNRDHRPRVITISVDGNISSGKSTLVSNLEKMFPENFGFQVELVPEPLEKWTDLKGHNLLGMFYDDPVKHNFMFQHYVQLTRLMETIKKPPEDKLGQSKGIVRIMERSLQNNRYCFTELARREGRLQQAEFAVLSEWHNWLEEKFDLNLDVIVYLRSSPETVYQRMQKRARQEESSVPPEYLKSLHETYEDWLIRGKLGVPTENAVTSENSNDTDTTTEKANGSYKQKIIVVDANQGKEEVAAECSAYLRAYMNEIGCEVGADENTATATPVKEKEQNGVH